MFYECISSSASHQNNADTGWTLTLDHLPFQAGEAVEVVIVPNAPASHNTNRYPLRGTPIRYEQPLEPVAEEDWDALATDVQKERCMSTALASLSTTYKAIIHLEEGGGYWAEVADLPGCFTQGATLDEVYHNLAEAIACHLDLNKDDVRVGLLEMAA